ncbi:MAG: hypothetical protein C0501_06205 [Isosphaera sp.]|nr:hypothetical protein [Isosphaera sp.]
MPRPLAVLLLPALVTPLSAADPTPVENQLALQKAMATARQYLDAQMPAEAGEALEAVLAAADGNKAFLGMLREAYLAELSRLGSDDPRAAAVRRKLVLLGGAAPAPKAPPAAAPSANPSADAAAAFKAGDYAAAARLFAAAGELTPNQKAVWAYCRVRVAADAVNAPGCDPAAAAAAARDVTAALALAPDRAELRKVGEAVIAAADRKGRAAAAAVKPAVESGDSVVETASFRVRYSGDRELADAVGKAAEAARTEIFERWSGPPAGAWGPKCEVVLHPTAAAYAKATGRPAESTGAATVRLTGGRATERRVDLRTDDPGLVANALPRELTHVVLADLFPDRPPPKWAEEGMAVLAGSPEEITRFARTLPRCARDGEWFAVAQLLELKDFPAEKITGFYCQSVSLTDHLVRAGGGRQFTGFLRDCQRYGTAAALKRQYNLDGPAALEAAWKRAALAPAP